MNPYSCCGQTLGVAPRPEGWFCDTCYYPWVVDEAGRCWTLPQPQPEWLTPAAIKARRRRWWPAPPSA